MILAENGDDVCFMQSREEAITFKFIDFGETNRLV